jgi:hypothetical protein
VLAKRFAEVGLADVVAVTTTAALKRARWAKVLLSQGRSGLPQDPSLLRRCGVGVRAVGVGWVADRCP